MTNSPPAQQIADEIALMFQTWTRCPDQEANKLKRLLIEFAEEVKREAIEP